ncbi:bacteriophage abortive infection AbiH family protein [Mucilaginibacter sp. R-33]|uniref:bacteriophage abortive infection AbiH family protein n=1 Tax=unclassified Mucilaginibacter TaxID=2617802 RepID=UPI003CF9167C
MSETLYIIGNGFDLHHGIASKYSDFKTYLAKHDRDLLYALEHLYDCENIWGDFETNLLTISRETFIDYISPFFPSNEVDDDDFTYAELFFSQDHAGNLVDELTESLRKCFHQWIRTLNMPQGYQQQLIKLDPNALYLSFNYTDFVETAYGAMPDQICYLHGKKSDKLGSIILGHGESPENSLENWQKANENERRFQLRLKNKRNKYYNNSNPTYLAYFLEDETKGNWRSEAGYHAINFAVERIEDYYEESSKNFKKVLQTHERFISSLNKIKKIAVIGHSLSKVDMPYFEKILEVNTNPKHIEWEISFHSEANLDRINDFAQELNIDSNYIKPFRLNERLLTQIK